MSVMTLDQVNQVNQVQPARGGQSLRLPALRRFAVAITLFNILGHTVFGFEQSWAVPLFALAVGYSTELLLETVDAWARRRRPAYAGGFVTFVEFLLPSHITSLACGMLLYSQSQFVPLAFAIVVALGSKVVMRGPVGKKWRHFLNPSNFGISMALLLFPWVSIAPPYHFTTNLHGAGDWLLPAFIFCSGTFLNARYTGKLVLIVSWLASFALQAVLRSLFFDASLLAALLPATGVGFMLFTFYMLTDPGTTPASRTGQILFGMGVAAVYGALQVVHLVYGLFLALVIVCTLRGLSLYFQTAVRWLRESSRQDLASPIEDDARLASGEFAAAV